MIVLNIKSIIECVFCAHIIHTYHEIRVIYLDTNTLHTLIVEV